MQRDAERLAGVLEVGHELAATIDLDGAQGERQGADEIHQEARLALPAVARE